MADDLVDTKLLAASTTVAKVLRQAHDADSIEDDEWQYPTMDRVLTEEFVALVLWYIRRRGSDWEYLLVMIGNMSSKAPLAEGEALLLGRLAEADGLVPLLIELSQSHEYARMPTGTPLPSTAVWIAANLATNVNEAAKASLQPMADVLSHKLETLREANAKTPDSRPSQEYMKTFRTLCCLLPSSDPRLHQDQHVLKWLLSEYDVALQGKSIPGSNLYPDAEDRALTLAQLCSDDWGRDQIVQHGGLAVLVKSLGMRHSKGAERTGLLWERAVRCIHLLVQSAPHRQLLKLCQGTVQNLQSVCSESRSEIKVSSATRKMAVDAVIALSLRWDIERLLWLGLEKNDPDTCPLSRLSHSLMRTIMVHFLWLDVDSACDFEVVPERSYRLEL